MMKKLFLQSSVLILALWAFDEAFAQENVQPIPMGIATPAAVPDASLNPPAITETAPASETVPAVAVTDPSLAPVALAPMEDDVNPNDIPSLLFTFWEHTAIVDAKRSRGLVRPPTEEELTRDLKSRETHKVKPPPEERDIRLGGIVYVSKGDWTIWLNDKRVTPKAIPAEVMDLKVSKEYIEMKWFDEYSNQIFPIRLRPHQRFNIDTRIFLPG